MMVRIPQIIRAVEDGSSPRHSLRATLMGWFMVVALLPLVAMGFLSYTEARQARQEEVSRDLAHLTAIEKQVVQAHFERAARELEHQSQLSANRELLLWLEADLHASGMEPRPWARSSRWHEMSSQLGAELVRFRNTSPWYDISLIDTLGVMVFSCRQEDDLGTNVLTGPYAGGMLGQSVHLSHELQHTVLSDFAVPETSGGTLSAYMAVPVNDAAGNWLGTMTLQIDSRSLTAETIERSPLTAGTTVYLQDRNLQAVTSVGNEPGSAGHRIRTELSEFWRQTGRTQRGDRLAGATVGYPWSYVGREGKPVFGHAESFEALGRSFLVVAEEDVVTALSGLSRIRYAIFIVVAVTILMVILAGQFIAHRFVQPLTGLNRIMKRVADGHDVQDLNVTGHNEVGDLADQFAVMIERLNEAKQGRDVQYHLQRSQFELNEKMRGEPDTVTLAAAILDYIGDYYDAQVGAFYLAKPGQRLVLSAQLGEGDETWPLRELREGQSVAGRAAVRRQIELLTEVPTRHMKIRTALGESAPRTLIVAPFHLAGQIKGVMELGSGRALDDDDLDFLRVSAESIAVALDSARSRERVHRLLDETRRQAGTLARQQKELQDSNAELERTDRYKSEFLANMSHELRTPLNSMMLMSQVLGENRRGVLNPDEISSADTITQAGEELLMIIDDILDLSKVEAGKLDLTPNEIELPDLLEELVHLFRPVLDGQGLEFRCLNGPGVPTNVFTDGLRLKQILKNLLNNACKFTEEGTVVLRTRVPSRAELIQAGLDGEAEWFAVSVADTGIGMDPDVCRRVFEAFNQGDGTIGRRFGGSGLGLSISQRLALLLHGHLAVASVEGKGSTFTLYLPVQADFGPVAVAGAARESVPPVGVGASEAKPALLEQAREPAAEPMPEPVVADAKLLADYQLFLADDEMRTVFGLADELNQADLALKVERNAERLVQAIASEPGPKLILVNPWIGNDRPGGPDGSKLLAALSAADPCEESLVAALVPRGSSADLAGADMVLQKPVRLEQVVKACRSRLVLQGGSA